MMTSQILVHNFGVIQCDKFGRFLKVLGVKFSSKVAQMYVDFLGSFEIVHFHVWTAVPSYFLGYFWKFFWLLYISASGHTEVIQS